MSGTPTTGKMMRVVVIALVAEISHHPTPPVALDFSAPLGNNATLRSAEKMCEIGVRTPRTPPPRAPNCPLIPTLPFFRLPNLWQYFCTEGVRHKCDAGFMCRAGVSAQVPCGNASDTPEARVCFDGESSRVEEGMYSLGPTAGNTSDLAATELNRFQRTAVTVCEPGCVRHWLPAVATRCRPLPPAA